MHNFPIFLCVQKTMCSGGEDIFTSIIIPTYIDEKSSYQRIISPKVSQSISHKFRFTPSIAFMMVVFSYKWHFFNEKHWSQTILFFCYLHNSEFKNYGAHNIQCPHLIDKEAEAQGE